MNEYNDTLLQIGDTVEYTDRDDARVKYTGRVINIDTVGVEIKRLTSSSMSNISVTRRIHDVRKLRLEEFI